MNMRQTALSRQLAAWLALGALVGGPAVAAESPLRINGFLSAVGSQMNVPGKYGYTQQISDKLSFQPGSVLGMQFGYQLDKQSSFNAQLIARGVEDWAVNTEWAYWKFESDNQLSFKAGRQRTPYYFFSEAQEVGFAYPWVLPPMQRYNNELSAYDGIAVRKGWSGNWAGNVELLLGSGIRAKGQGNEETDSRTKRMSGLVFNLYKGFWTYRVSAIKGTFVPELDSTSTDAAMKNLVALNQALGTTSAGEFTDGVGVVTYDLAAHFENKRWFMLAEVGSVDYDDGVFTDDTVGMLTLGMHIQRFSPYILLSKGRTNSEGNTRRNDLIAELEANNKGSQDIYDAIQGYKVEEKSFSAGVRYDLQNNVDCKFQVTRVTGLQDTHGYFEETPGRGNATIAMVSLDAMF
ncbi:MAG TPA: hypothetical protein VFM46_17160 [Pseudomonadales bacterium]|nr:hypothetical protein [Pseudomonadales bacterium]